MKIGDFEIKIVTVKDIPEDEARIGYLEIIYINGKRHLRFREQGRFINIGESNDHSDSHTG